MIVTITENTPRVAFKLSSYGGKQLYTNWQELQLVITPLPSGPECPGFVPLSPWYFTGCWFPPTRTDVNVNAPNRDFDFSPIVYDAFEADADGRVVFLLDEKFWSLPRGRYLGMIRTYPAKVTTPVVAGVGPVCGEWPREVPAQNVTCTRCCVLASFDIDYGPITEEFFIGQITANLSLQEDFD